MNRQNINSYTIFYIVILLLSTFYNCSLLEKYILKVQLLAAKKLLLNLKNVIAYVHCITSEEKLDFYFPSADFNLFYEIKFLPYKI